jgi:hypothetical protein
VAVLCCGARCCAVGLDAPLGASIIFHRLPPSPALPLPSYIHITYIGPFASSSSFFTCHIAVRQLLHSIRSIELFTIYTHRSSIEIINVDYSSKQLSSSR